MHSLVQPYRQFEQFQGFEQFQEPAIATQPFFIWRNAHSNANLPAASVSFFQHPQHASNLHQAAPYQRVATTISGWPQQPQTQSLPQQSIPQDNPWQFYIPPVSNKTSTPHSNVAKPKPSFWEEFKRIYITEVIAFTMSKSTLFTLIFSFMFLGCIFFLSGFFTATNIYRQQNAVHETSRPHTPTDTAMLQGRPEKMVSMGAGIAFTTPKAYHSQGGVRVDQNTRRPSQHTERQIANGHPHYR